MNPVGDEMRTMVMLTMILFVASGILSQSQTLCRAWVEIDKDGSATTITGRFYNNTVQDLTLTYRLEAEKTGPSGRSSTKQSGSFVAEGQKEVSLSKVVLNIQPNDSCKVTLHIVDGETIVASDSILYHGDSQEER